MDTPPITPTAKPERTPPSLKPRPIHLILDFDSTITREDTTSILAEIARDRLSRSDQEKWDYCQRWRTCCEKYMAEIERHPDVRALKGKKKTTLSEEISYQRSLRVIEEASVSRVGESAIFKGVAAWVWRESGWRACQMKKVMVRSGFRKLVESVQADQAGRWGIVSVNWSQEFLKGVLSDAIGDVAADRVPVLSNRVIGETGFIVGPKFGPGPRLGTAARTEPVGASKLRVDSWSFRQLQTLNEGRLLLSCEDKLEAMRSLRDSFQGSPRAQISTILNNMANYFARTPGEKPPAPIVVYVGDSMTDIECLLEADVGIVMSLTGSCKLMEALGRYNISVIHISFWGRECGKSIWFARDFSDIVTSKLFTDFTTKPPIHGARNYIERWLRDTRH